MGASDVSSTTNAAKLEALQDRKHYIEDSIAKCTLQLKDLCIQESNLTGTIPLEMPLEPGESPPLIRRRIKTAFQLSANLINTTNKDESLVDMELQLQLHGNMAEAALGLANQQNISKTLRRQHITDYQQHKNQFTLIQEKLAVVKSRDQALKEQIQKQRKKPRPVPDQIDKALRYHTSCDEKFFKEQNLNSVRGVTPINKTVSDNQSVQSFSQQQNQQPPLTNSNISTSGCYYDRLGYGLYRLSLNDYKNYLDRCAANANVTSSQVGSHCNGNSTQCSFRQHKCLLNNNINNGNSIINANTLPCYSESSSPIINRPKSLNRNVVNNNNTNSIPSKIHNRIQLNMQRIVVSGNNSNNNSSNNNKPVNITKNTIVYNLLTTPNINADMQQLSSPISLDQTSGIHQSDFYANNNQSPTNLHQIPPHKRYEHYHHHHSHQQHHHQQKYQLHHHQRRPITVTNPMEFCKRTPETTDQMWYVCDDDNDTATKLDKHFGSLDRTKYQRYQKSTHSNNNRMPALNSDPQTIEADYKPMIIHTSHDSGRQLVRTQSLGTVGGVDIWHKEVADDAVSLESDDHSFRNSSTNLQQRKRKTKEWIETSLDEPIITSRHTAVSVSAASPSPVLSPEEKYVNATSQLTTVKNPLEIPAESIQTQTNSTTQIRLQETNFELLNNNIPKNCTLVQAGQCKPYYEETKPFEMSDFYKYSTKFKRNETKPTTDDNQTSDCANSNANNNQRPSSLLTTVETTMLPSYANTKDSNSSWNVNGNQTLASTPTSLNSTLDGTQIANCNVAESFSNEMKLWYNNQSERITTGTNNNNTSSNSNNPNNEQSTTDEIATATLV